MTEPKEDKLKVFPAITRLQLINRLNALHFQNESLLICLRHLVHDFQVRLRAIPQPTSDERVKALWQKDETFPHDLTSYRLENTLIPGARRTLEFSPINYWLDDDGIYLELPEHAREVSGRSTTRHDCRHNHLQAELAQSSIVFSGELLDFSPQGIRFQARAIEGQNFHWLNVNRPAIFTITRAGVQLYSGPVSMSWRESNEDALTRIYILEPVESSVPRFLPRKYRARRETFRPSPDMVFHHPIIGRKCTLKIIDLAGQGFAVEEDPTNPVLMAGMLLENVQLYFANSLCLTCTAQVVYHGVPTDTGLRSGIALLDMSTQDHLKLVSLIQQARDQKSYISAKVDSEALFEFFFETGFIYPHKYAEIAVHRDEFRQAYKRLYESDVDIARHFVYLDANRIQGHFASLRVFRNTWMNQHHAALSSSRAGFKVVRAISEYLNDSFAFNPANLKYIIGFYRPDNKFPEKYFGGFVRQVNDRKITSLDLYGYVKRLSDIVQVSGSGDMAGKWELARVGLSDLVEFSGFYEKLSGGLLPEVLDLTPHAYSDPTLEKIYRENGMKRERFIYAVRHNRSVKALIDVHDSDLGLNMSELTNAIFVYVLDSTAFQREIMEFVLSALAIKHNKAQQPIMIYPAAYAEKHKIRIDKLYNLWAMGMKGGYEDYMDWMERYCRSTKA
jgi:hypothetical protein